MGSGKGNSMKSPIVAATEHHLAMSAIRAKPKPVRQKSGTSRKSGKVKSRRKILEQQLEAMVKQIIFWRDGQECVQHGLDGARCGNGLMWGHYVAQKQSHWLKYDLGNVFVQCGNHNLLDHNGDKSYSVWFANTFGQEAANATVMCGIEHRGIKRTIAELEEMLAHYDHLFENRFYADENGNLLNELVKAGYYGYIIKAAWIKDGKL